MHAALTLARRLPCRAGPMLTMARLGLGASRSTLIRSSMPMPIAVTANRRSAAAVLPSFSRRFASTDAPAAAETAAPTQPEAEAAAAAAPSTSALPIRDQLSSTLRHLLEFKSQLPADIHLRLSSAVASGGYSTGSAPLKILVVADRHVGRGALINTLLQYPQGKAVINETWGTEVYDVITLAKGDVFKEETVEANVRHIKVPSAAVEGTEWTIVPPLSTNWPHLPAYLTTHDLVLFITDTPRHLSTPLESLLAATLRASGHPVFVVVNGTDYLAQPQLELPLILSSIQSRAGPTTPIFPTSTRRASLAQYLGTPTSADDDQASGVPALALAIQSTAANAITRQQVQRLATLAAASRALDHLDAQVAQAYATLDALDKQFAASVTAKIISEQTRLLEDFHARDLRKVHEAIARVAASVREFFDNVPFWRLFWAADGLSADLKHSLRAHVLSEAESRMATAAGRLGEGLRYTWMDLERSVEAMRTHVQLKEGIEDQGNKAEEPANEPVAAAMRSLLDRVATVCKQDAATIAHVDSFALSNVVWRYRAQYEAGDHLQHVRSTAEHLVLRTGSIVALAWVAALTGMANHLVDPAIGAALGFGASGAALEAMRRGWAKFEDGYLQTIAGVEEGMSKDLKDEYHRLVHDKLTVPMSNLVDLYELASKEQRREVDEAKRQIAKVRKEVEQVRERVVRGE
ncbi:hypothetical protein BCR44DRAFT_56578 [Catenaria anguillulae PL171]|uniref:Uncharacterized protein n=1 Tax=Catenaria anguillulae PL171 TaxID=765915 RepID=A0A1Y2HTU3_9FUNG|nr:hypothetical protein BCR44DRAFT_56578 [Catenaria anguillulae PL171]